MDKILFEEMRMQIQQEDFFMYNKLKQIAAAALFAAAVTATTVQAQEIQAMAPEAVASVNGPGVKSEAKRS